MTSLLGDIWNVSAAPGLSLPICILGLQLRFFFPNSLWAYPEIVSYRFPPPQGHT